jgi:hypothetical protein
MTDKICTYSQGRDETLIAFLYRDIDPAERVAFEAHLAACATCRKELDTLAGVRAELARWAPPEPSFAMAGHQSPATSHRAGWRDIPAWAQIAAAMLFLGVSAGLANLDVRYDRGGLSVRTGWSRPAVSSVAQGAAPANAPWRNDVAALGEELRGELRASQTAAPAPATLPAPRSAPALDADLVRRIKALIDESERRQQTELALRVAQVERDVYSQRQADLRKIDQNLGRMQDQTGVEVLKQRQMLNYLVQRVSQRQ